MTASTESDEVLNHLFGLILALRVALGHRLTLATVIVDAPVPHPRDETTDTRGIARETMMIVVNATDGDDRDLPYHHLENAILAGPLGLVAPRMKDDHVDELVAVPPHLLHALLLHPLAVKTMIAVARAVASAHHLRDGRTTLILDPHHSHLPLPRLQHKMMPQLVRLDLQQ